MAHKIGIGVSSYKRREHLELWIKQYAKHKTEDMLSYCSLECNGIAQAKNKCISELKDCDYIFLFDDDCMPIADGWAEYFIDAHKKTGNHHFMYLNYHHHPNYSQEGVTSYKSCGGCFMFLTKEVIEKVGYYNSKYNAYGYEHAGYSNRIHQAGLTPYGMYLCPDEAHKYIHSMDIDTPIFDIKHKPSLPISECVKSVELNKPIYLEDIKTIYQPMG